MYITKRFTLKCEGRQDEGTSLLNDRIASQSGLYFISNQAYLKRSMLTIVFAGIILLLLCIFGLRRSVLNSVILCQQFLVPRLYGLSLVMHCN